MKQKSTRRSRFRAACDPEEVARQLDMLRGIADAARQLQYSRKISLRKTDGLIAVKTNDDERADGSTAAT